MSKFDITRPPLAKFRTNFLRLAWLAILFLILPVLFIVSGALDVRRDWFLILPFIVVPVGISIYRVILLLTNLDLEVLVYNDGFTYSKNGKTREYPWKEIDKVWTTRYELISIIYVKYLKMKILDVSGKTLILDRTLQNVDKFEALVQEQVAREKFPRAISMLQEGMSLEFGTITITKDYIKTEHETIPWNELGDLQTWQGTLRLWRKGKRAISIMAGISSTPNFVFLVSLVGYLKDHAQASPFPLPGTTYERATSNISGTSARPKAGNRMKPGGNTDARLSGLFIFLLGAGLGYWQIFLPIKKAFQGQAHISYFSEATILTPMAVFFGLFLLIFGAEGLGFLSKPSSKLGLVLFLIGLLVFILGCYFGMQFIMRGLGYY